MLQAEAYEVRSAAFCEGPCIVGSWEQGAKIHLLAPSADGMAAEIAENRLDEVVSIRHLGEERNGVEDTTSDKVCASAPAHENDPFTDAPQGCSVTAKLDTLPEYEDCLRKTAPQALAFLGAWCGAGPRLINTGSADSDQPARRRAGFFDSGHRRHSRSVSAPAMTEPKTAPFSANTKPTSGPPISAPKS